MIVFRNKCPFSKCWSTFIKLSGSSGEVCHKSGDFIHSNFTLRKFGPLLANIVDSKKLAYCGLSKTRSTDESNFDTWIFKNLNSPDKKISRPVLKTPVLQLLVKLNFFVKFWQKNKKFAPGYLITYLISTHSFWE